MFTRNSFFLTFLIGVMYALVTCAAPSWGPSSLAVKRDDSPNPILCNINDYVSASYYYSQGNIQSVRDEGTHAYVQLPSQPLNGSKCTRVGCQYNSGIYVCNDNDDNIDVGVQKIADYAQAILDTADCDSWIDGGENHQVQGQAFDAERWNVIVGMYDGEQC